MRLGFLSRGGYRANVPAVSQHRRRITRRRDVPGSFALAFTLTALDAGIALVAASAVVPARA
jgi:hypothetical protein